MTVTGTNNINVEYFYKEADVIGAYNIPTIYTTRSPVPGTIYVPLDYFCGTSSSGTNSIYAEYFSADDVTLSSGVKVYLTEYSAVDTISGTSDAYVEYFCTDDPNKALGEQYACINYVAGQKTGDELDISVPVHYWFYQAQSTTKDIIANYKNLAFSTSAIDNIVNIDFVPSASGSKDVLVDILFNGWVNYPFYSDIVCGSGILKHGYSFESTMISGAVWGINYDIYSTVVASVIINTDVYCGLVDLVSYAWESEVISGAISYCDYELYCGLSNTQGFSFDVDLFSLNISNFSLAEGEYSSATGTICVDVTDDVYNVVTSGTYFIIDGTMASGIFTPITHGYRMCYDPVDDFASLLGATTFTVHAENDDNGVLERDYYLTAGYIVEYNNENQDYGYESQVVVRMSAENFASCPLYSTEAYWFKTLHKAPKDLSASIVGVPWSTKDLTASISSETELIYFYGKTFRVEIRAKDFAGNIMSPYTFEFQIEDKPN